MASRSPNYSCLSGKCSVGILLITGLVLGQLLTSKFQNVTIFDQSQALTKFEMRSCTLWRHLLDETYRKCLRDAINRSFEVWKQWSELVTYCLGGTLGQSLTIHPLLNKDDVKYAILPPKPSTDSECTVVTIGIGNDTGSELQLRQKHPGCQFFGADPMKEVGSLYSAVGVYSEIAVGEKTGSFNANVLIGPGIYDYTVRTVPALSLEDYIKHKVGRLRVDHLWMDAEGSEYSMLPKFFRGGSLDTEGITVCQLNVEFHGPLKNYNQSEDSFNSLVARLVADSDFLPFIVHPPQYHLRAFFLNVKSEYCAEKLFTQWCT